MIPSRCYPQSSPIARHSRFFLSSVSNHRIEPLKLSLRSISFRELWPSASVLLLVSLIGGCSLFSQQVEPANAAVDYSPDRSVDASNSTSPPGSISSARSELVARDLVNALVQIQATAPRSTQLNFAKPESNYGKVLARELQRAGYDMRLAPRQRTSTTRTQNGLSIRYLDYAIRSVKTSSRPAYQFTVIAGDVRVRRDYALEQEAIYPASSLYIYGASPAGITLNDDIFLNQSRPKASDLLIKEPADSVDQNTSSDLLVLNGSMTNNSDVAKATAVPEDPKPVPLVATSLSTSETAPAITNAEADVLRPRKIQNMYDLKKSNFDSVFDQYDELDKKILIFNNDSVVLGSRNKRLIRNMLKSFEDSSDLLSVIGCSHGKTTLADGNRKLALGRSSRVREELILLGISPDSVLDEGCWANQHFDGVMPRRGVVLSLKRRRSAS